MPAASVMRRGSMSIRPPARSRSLSNIFVFAARYPIIAAETPAIPISAVQVVRMMLPAEASIPKICGDKTKT